MHQLKALLWRSYRIRSRQYYTTALDLFGPLIIISLYVATKILLDQTHAPQVDESAAKIEYFSRGTPTDHIDLKLDIKRHMCTKILYFPGSRDDQSSSIVSHLSNECGFQLTEVSSRRELVRGLQKSLASRVAYQSPQTDLNKINSTNDNCIRLSSRDNDQVIYQIGLARSGQNVVEIHMTDSAGSPVIFMPYSQGSTYNEYKLPHSDLNLGTHLIEICLANAFRRDASPRPPSPTSSPTPSSIATSVATTTTTTTLPPSTSLSPSPTRYSRKFATRRDRLTYGVDRQGQNAAKLIQNIKWRHKPYPVLTGVFVVPISTCIAILLAYLCTNTATVMRVTDDIEFGLHRYVRLAGLPAGYYWLSNLIMTIIQSFVQSLIISIMLGVYTGNYTYDPICESAMTTRWMLLFTYSLMANTHVIFLASLFDRSSNAVLACCMLGSCYSTYTLLLILQWTPYGFKPMTIINWIALLNPASNMLALSCVLIAVAMQTNEPFGWSHLSERIIGGGFSELSVAELWALMLIQIVVSMLVTILIDQFKYSTTKNFLGFICALLNELCFCNYCGPHSDKLTEDLRTKSSAQSKKDPNRICCSMRHVGVSGSTIMMPYTKGNPLKLSKEQMRALRAQGEERTVSKTTQLLINTRSISARDLSGPSSHKVQPLLLDDVIRQNLVWYKTDIKFKDLSLDFRFNQITFVLGQTDLKELLFAALLGASPMGAGHVIIDGTYYSASTMGLARQDIGYLSDKDIFYNDLTIFENLQFFGSIRETSYKSYDSESLYVLSLLHLSSRRDNFPATLTHRSARKLALGVASVGYTKLLLLTEPTLNLRWRPRCQVHNLLKKYKSIRSIVVDSSDVDEAVAFGDRIVLLKNGSAELSDTPEKLTKRLACGYWLVFEPTTGDGRTINTEAIRALERLTNEVFKQDKLDLDASKVSIYQDLARAQAHSTDTAATTTSRVSGGGGGGAPSSVMAATGNITATSQTARRGGAGETHRLMVIVKVQHTNQSSRALCSVLKMFANRNIHGFKLAQVSYESLEDILVLRMARALYPDLPPDLLLSLQHRTQVTQKSSDPSPISVRRLSSNYQTAGQQTPTSSTIFAAGMTTVIRDRLRNTSELFVTLMALIVSLIVVLVTLLLLRSTLRAGGGQQSGDVWNASTPPSSYQISQLASDSSPGGRQNHPFMARAVRDRRIVELSSTEQLYKNRLGFYVLAQGSRKKGPAATAAANVTNTKTNDSDTDAAALLKAWHGNRNLAGVVYLGDLGNQTDAQAVANLVDKSRDLAGSLIVFDPRTSEATIIFEPHLPHVFLASVKTLIDFSYATSSAASSVYRRLARVGEPETTPALLDGMLKNQTLESRAREVYEDYVSPVYTTRVNFHHPWHEMIQGLPTRRVIYGVGFAIAEAIMMGALVVAPLRHRSESKLTRVQTCYWLSLAAFDLVISLIQIIGYITLFILIEGLVDGRLISAMLIVLLLYKVASLPIAYLTSMAAETSSRAFLFIMLLYFTVVWDMAIFLKAFVEWTIYSDSYLYTISNWILFGLPITGLVESLVVINQINTINLRCPEIPAYTATTNTVDLQGVRRNTIVDTLLDKVHECLASGKTAISTNVMHRQGLGILWTIYLTLLFGLIIWAFLLTSERLFGLVARRLSSTKTSNDPMKTVIRLPDHTTSLFVWDKERDRLISEYIRCMNEFKYVQSMAHNCLILRIWLKPMSDHASPDHHLSSILEPLIGLGHGKNDIQVELRTTLQIFVRIGDETRHCRVDKIQLIETYSKYVAAHGDIVAKFAVVDWTRENLYKILLHGHYNNKTSTPAVT